MEVKKLKDPILNGSKCPYCGKDSVYMDSAFFYNGQSFGMVWACVPCRAFVGCHPGTDISLGRLAAADLRVLKMKTHEEFDKLWKTGAINRIWRKYLPETTNRKKAYIWLARELGISSELCHIGMFDAPTCFNVIDICLKALNKVWTESHDEIMKKFNEEEANNAYIKSMNHEKVQQPVSDETQKEPT